MRARGASGAIASARRALPVTPCRFRARVKFAVNTETNERVAIKILDKEKIQKQVGGPPGAGSAAARSRSAPGAGVRAT